VTEHQPDSAKAAAFVSSLPGEHHPLFSVHVNDATKKKGRVAAATFKKGEAAQREWFEARQGSDNCYYTLNPTIGPMDSKPANTDIKEVIALHVDIDPYTDDTREETRARALAELEGYDPPPHIIVASGNGYQGIWLIDTPIPINGDAAAAEDAKLYNYKIAHDVGGDDCYAVSWVLRAPYSLINCDEFGNMATSKYVMLLQSNLRAGQVPTRMALAANPGGRLHSVITQRWLSKAAPWTVFEIDGVKWIRCPGTWLDNRENLPVDYPKRLLAAAGNDKELAKAWLEGRWDVLKGSMFADVLDPNDMLDSGRLGFDHTQGSVVKYVAGDWGQAAPTVAFSCAKLLSPQGRFPRNSIILLDEYHTADPTDLSVGIPTAPGRVAEEILNMQDRTFGKGQGRQGYFDQSRGLGVDETLLGLFRAHGLNFQLPPKSRTQGWSLLREMLFNAHTKNGKPGFWATERCSGFWATAPSCPRDERNPEDLDTRSVDHWLDGARYSVTGGALMVPIFSREVVGGY
jgi:hypothetical protein